MPPEEHKSLARSLGEFVGHIVHAVKAPADPAPDAERHEVRRETSEQTADTPLGPAILRRTVIEEIEIRRDA